MKKIGLGIGIVTLISVIFTTTTQTQEKKLAKALTHAPLLITKKDPFKDLSPEKKRTVLAEECKNLAKLARQQAEKPLIKKRHSRRLLCSKNRSAKINVLIIGIGGGGGHRNAADALTKILNNLPNGKDLFNIVYVEPFMNYFSDVWNKDLQEENGKRLAAHISKKCILDFGLGFFPFTSILRSSLKNALPNPNVIIQVQHVGAARFKRIAKEMGAQFRIIPTDLDVSQFIHGIKNIKADDFGCSLDIMGGIPELPNILEKKSIKNYNLVGYPTRLEILELAEKLYHKDSSIKKKAEKEVFQFLEQQNGFGLIDGSIKDDITFKKGDSVIFIMIGAKGTLQSRILRYLHIIAEHADRLAPKHKKVHIFLAQADTYIDALKNELIAFTNTTKNLNVVVHALGKVSAKEVGMLMHSGITLCKAGGSTIAELLTLKAPAVFDMSVSNFIVWEKYNADLFVKNNWGIQLKNSNDGKEVADALKQAFNLHRTCHTSMPTNHFHLDWPKAFMDDLSGSLSQQLLQ